MSSCRFSYQQAFSLIIGDASLGLFFIPSYKFSFQGQTPMFCPVSLNNEEGRVTTLIFSQAETRPICLSRRIIEYSVYTRFSGCPAIQSRRAASIRDCQPAPVDLKYSTTSEDKRMAVGILVVSAFGLPGLRTTFADAKKFCTCSGLFGSYRSVSGSYLIGASVAASRCTRSQSVFEFFFKPGMISLPFIFVGSTETDDPPFFAR